MMLISLCSAPRLISWFTRGHALIRFGVVFAGWVALSSSVQLLVPHPYWIDFVLGCWFGIELADTYKAARTMREIRKRLVIDRGLAEARRVRRMN
jgi:hypothetical protein